MPLQEELAPQKDLVENSISSSWDIPYTLIYPPSKTFVRGVRGEKDTGVSLTKSVTIIHLK